METLFRAAAAVIAGAALAVRFSFARRGRGGEERIREPVPLALQAVSLVLGSASLALFIAYPRALGLFAVPLPAWARAAGAAIGVLAVALLLWSHAALGKEFSPFLLTRKEQRLVEAGPYRFIRHPMYASYFMQTCAWALISSNAAVALAWIPLAAGLVIRIGIEERMMAERFGRRFADYASRTGRVFPRL